MTKKLSSLSIFFPAYNEAGNIAEAIEQALTIAPQVAEEYEVIVINDGSQDATLQIARRLARKNTKIRVINQINQGYGGALKRGFQEAKFEWIFFSDSDLQFDLQELKKLIRFTQRHDLVLGYRLNRAEGIKRQVLAYALKLWNRVLLGFPRRIKDVDCAFKLIHRRVLKQVDPLIANGAMISTELLLKSHLAHFKYTQVGVTHYQRRTGQSTGNNLKVIFKAIVDTFKLKWQLSKQQAAASFSNFAFRS